MRARWFLCGVFSYVHIDSCEFRHADGKIHMLLAEGVAVENAL